MVDESLIDREMSCLKSLNPAFLNRAVAPVFQYLGPAANAKEFALADGIPPFDRLFLPVPPVLVRIFDIDIGKGDEVFKEMIGVIVEWSPANLDLRYKTIMQEQTALDKHHSRRGDATCKGTGATLSSENKVAGFETDVNYAHEAVWYSLVNNEQVTFGTVERSVAKSLEWDMKPRLLAAVGFALEGVDESTMKHLEETEAAALANELDTARKTRTRVSSSVPWPVVPLDSPAGTASRCNLLRYHFDIDILGLRFLPTAHIDQTTELVLQVSAFWQGRAADLQLALSSSDYSGPNVLARLSEAEPVRMEALPRVVE